MINMINNLLTRPVASDQLLVLISILAHNAFYFELLFLIDACDYMCSFKFLSTIILVAEIIKKD